MKGLLALAKRVARAALSIVRKELGGSTEAQVNAIGGLLLFVLLLPQAMSLLGVEWRVEVETTWLSTQFHLGGVHPALSLLMVALFGVYWLLCTKSLGGVE